MPRHLDSATNSVDLPDRVDGMLTGERDVLRELLIAAQPKDVLEIGMANGSSTVSILQVLAHLGGGNATSIDPYQKAPAAARPGAISGYGGAGLENVRNTGLEHMHTLLDAPDYLALPRLVEQGQRFDFVFVDGYHAFDYVMLDLFYADLLLRPGGLVVLHDSNRPTVFTACRFIAANKAYTSIGPPLLLSLPTVLGRATRRLWHVVSGQSSRYADRRDRWKSLAAFRKERDGLADEIVLRGF